MLHPYARHMLGNHMHWSLPPVSGHWHWLCSGKVGDHFFRQKTLERIIDITQTFVVFYLGPIPACEFFWAVVTNIFRPATQSNLCLVNSLSCPENVSCKRNGSTSYKWFRGYRSCTTSSFAVFGSTMTKVIIVGCGIAGPVLALLLQQNGFEPVIYERGKRSPKAGLSLTCAFLPLANHIPLNCSWQASFKRPKSLIPDPRACGTAPG